MAKVKDKNKKSSIPVETGFPNPMYGVAGVLMQDAEAYKKLMLEVQNLQKSGLSFTEIKNQMEASGMRARLRVLFERATNVEPTRPVIGPPPRTNDLYGRFGRGCDIVDIGSGDGKKLRKYSGHLKITCVDPNLSAEVGVFKNNFKMTICDFLLGSEYAGPETLFSSVMVLCQLKPPDIERVLEHDGLHIVPDHVTLLGIGAAENSGDKILVRAPSRDFYDEPTNFTGLPIRVGYLMVTSFKPRSINIALQGESSIVDYKPEIDASPIPYDKINTDDVSYKMDGVPWEIELNDGDAYMVNRAGQQFIGSSNFMHYACLHVEELQSCFTLIRIVMFRGYVPPHALDVLEAFAEKVKIEINGKPICAPPRWKLDHRVLYRDANGIDTYFNEKTDGIISRENGKDGYCKYMWTVDMLPDQFAILTTELTKIGLMLEVDIQQQLWEYGVNRMGDTVQLQPLRIRTDKLIPTTVQTAIFLLSQKTAPEIHDLDNL